MVTGLLGAFFAFLAGLVALRWLSSWLEEGRWYLFRNLLSGRVSCCLRLISRWLLSLAHHRDSRMPTLI